MKKRKSPIAFVQKGKPKTKPKSRARPKKKVPLVFPPSPVQTSKPVKPKIKPPPLTAAKVRRVLTVTPFTPKQKPPPPPPEAFLSLEVVQMDEMREKTQEAMEYVKKYFKNVNDEALKDNVQLYIAANYIIEKELAGYDRDLYKLNRDTAALYLKQFGFVPAPKPQTPQTPQKPPPPPPTTPLTPVPLSAIKLNVKTFAEFNISKKELEAFEQEGRITEQMRERAEKYMSVKLQYNRVSGDEKRDLYDELVERAKDLREKGFKVPLLGFRSKVAEPEKKPEPTPEKPEPTPEPEKKPEATPTPEKKKKQRPAEVLPEQLPSPPKTKPEKLLAREAQIREALKHINLNITKMNDYQKTLPDIDEALTAIGLSDRRKKMRLDSAKEYMRNYLELNAADAAVATHSKNVVEQLTPDLEKLGFTMKVGGHCGEECRAKKTPRRPSDWVLHVKQWAKSHRVKYGVALNSKACREAYHSKNEPNPPPITSFFKPEPSPPLSSLDLDVKNKLEEAEVSKIITRGVNYKHYPKEIHLPVHQYTKFSILMNRAENPEDRLKYHHELHRLAKELNAYGFNL
jgi:hypothetical protein